MNTKTLAFFSLLLTASCAETVDQDVLPPPARVDGAPYDANVNEAATDAADTSVADAGKDFGPDAETCVYPATETRPCGACGTQSRFCLPDGVFTGWTGCSGERAGVECMVGEKRESDCGNCGKASDYCDVKECKWVTGACLGEGPCAPGDEESTKASCAVAGEVRTRTCDDKCQWSDFSSCSLPKGWLAMETAPIGGRIFHGAVWTGSRMIVWGGYGSSPTYKSDGASYDPLSNKWKALAPAPSVFSGGRRNLSAVWTGSRMIVFGGRDGSSPYKDGAVYDPSTDSWTTIASPALTARHSMAAVWSTTTNEMIVWGGCTGSTCSSVAADGAAYDPATNTWTALPPAPIVGRGDPSFAWTGTELVVFGGVNASSTGLADGARFDPKNRTWVKFSEPKDWVARFDSTYTWSGTSLFVWGGRSTSTTSTARGEGAFYTPMVGWTAIPATTDTVFAPNARRYDVASWFGGGRLWLFSGIGAASSTPTTGLASYDPATETWKSHDIVGAPGARARATAVWTGKEAILWGGASGDTCCTYYNTGGVYRP